MGHFDYFDSNNYDLNLESKKGIMIIHGFSSTTFETLPLAKFLAEKGFRVSTHNLPGHGTTVEDCNSTKFQDWLNFVEINLAELSSSCDELYVVGLSMGSVLGLYLAGLFPINKLVTCATVLNFKDPFRVNYLVPIFNKILVKQKKVKKTSKNKHKRYSGYDHYPLIALNEFRKLNNYVKKRLKLVKCPMLYVHSKVDGLSLPSNVDLVLNNVSSKIKNKLIVNHASHHLFYESKDKDLIFNTIHQFIKD
tara:strand:+ start:2384 stop:3133 length:750 start_codon:yes stop_codon:yes gene_type:complete